MASLKRHRGTDRCAHAYWANELRTQFKLPSGYAVLDNDHFVWTIAREAGFTPEDSPVRRAVLWHEGNDIPLLRTIAPTWLAIVNLLLMDEWQRMWQERYTLMRDVKDDADLAAEYKYELQQFTGVHGALRQDAVTLLRRFADAPEGNLEALALGTELDLAARVTTDYGYHFDCARVLPIVRRWASDVLTHNL